MHCSPDFSPTHLRLISDEDVILHGVRDVVHGELEEGSFRDIDQANTSPGGAAVKWVWPGNYCHSLKGRNQQLTTRNLTSKSFLVDLDAQ